MKTIERMPRDAAAIAELQRKHEAHEYCDSCGVAEAWISHCGAPVDGGVCGRACCLRCTTQIDQEVYFCPGHARPMSGATKRGVAPKRQPLEVWTARVSYAGTDRLDITRKGGDPIGVTWAPTWATLRPLIVARAESDVAEEGAWQTYIPAYRAEMRASYRTSRQVWNELLARERVTLVCFCVRPERCHRSLLAGYLSLLGARCLGER